MTSYSITVFFDDLFFISTILFLSLSLLFHFSPCLHLYSFFVLFSLSPSINYSFLSPNDRRTHDIHKQRRQQICTHNGLPVNDQRTQRERLIVYRAATLDANRFRFFLFFSVLHGFGRKKTGKIRYVFPLERFSRIVFVFNNVFLQCDI